MKDKLQKILKVISSIIFVVLIIIIVLFAVYILGVKYLEKENRLDEVPINFYTILTQSMYPKIKMISIKLETLLHMYQVIKVQED